MQIVTSILTNDAFVLTDAVAFSSAHFGAGTGTIYMDYVGCTGSENNLIDCSRSTSFGCFGSHSQDAGVRCQGLIKWSTNIAFMSVLSTKAQCCNKDSLSYSKCHWNLYLWKCSSSGRVQSV